MEHSVQVQKAFSHVRTQFEHKCELGSTGRSTCTSVARWQQDSLVGILWAIPMDLQLGQGAGGRRHARGGGELACVQEEGRASRCQGASGRAWGGTYSGVRRLRILAGHQRGVGVHMQGCTYCVQEGAGPEEVLLHVDDGVADSVEHLDGRVSPHRAWRGARTHNNCNKVQQISRMVHW